MTDSPTPDQVDAIAAEMREAASKATPGKWTWYTPDKGYLDDYIVTDAPEYAPTDKDRFRNVVATTECRGTVGSANAVHICASSPANVLAILADRDVLKARVEALEAALRPLVTPPYIGVIFRTG